MIRRLKVKIRKIEQAEKNILWELATIGDLDLMKFQQGEIKGIDEAVPAFVSENMYYAEFSTKLKKKNAISKIANVFMRKELKAFEVIEIK